MEATFSIEGSLEHDGDGVVSLRLALNNGEFAASTSVWADCGCHLKLVAALSGFPASPSSIVNFSFGVPRSGSCELEFICLDSLGHLGLWATFSSTYAASRTDRYQSAQLFMRCNPSDVDAFVAAVSRFMPGEPNRAVLCGVGA